MNSTKNIFLNAHYESDPTLDPEAAILKEMCARSSVSEMHTGRCSRSGSWLKKDPVSVLSENLLQSDPL